MIEIKPQTNSDGTITFNANDGSYVTIGVDDDFTVATVIKINTISDDNGVYDGLIKSAQAYVVSRGLEFKTEICREKKDCRQNCESCRSCLNQ